MNDLPTNWSRVTLGDVIAGFEAGRNLRASSSPAAATEFGVLKISAVSWGKFQPRENKALLPGDRPMPRELVRKGDLLISRANTTELVGAPVLVDRDYDNLMLPDKILRVKYNREIVDPRYLLYALRTKSTREHIERQATGTSDSMRNLSQPKLSAVPIPLAPLAEQKRIADKLDRLLAAVDTCKARLDAIPAILKRFRQSVLAAATSGELTAEWRIAKAVPPVWTRVAVSDLCEIQNGRSFPSSSYAENGVRLLRPGNLAQSGDVEWNASNTVYLPPSFTREYPEFLLGAGELLMNLTAQSLKDEFLGRVCLKNDATPALLNQRIARLVPKTEYDVRPWLFLFFKSPTFRAFVDSLDSGTLIRHMHSKQVRDYEVELPCVGEQQEIWNRVDTLFTAIDSLAAKLDVAKARVDELPQTLLAKAFRGEFVAQDPSDRHAGACESIRFAGRDVAGRSVRRKHA